MNENILYWILSENKEIYFDIMKTVNMFILIFLTNYKLINKKVEFKITYLIHISFAILVSIICGMIRYKMGYLISLVCMIIMISVLFNKDNLKYSTVITLISTTINFVINFFSIIIITLPTIIFRSNNDYINEILIFILRIIMLINIMRIKRFKYGFQFLKNRKENLYLDFIILNVSSIILFSLMIFPITDVSNIKLISLIIIILSIIMFVTIQKMIQLTYKQKLLIQDLTETKKELEEKKKEVEDLEKENLRYSLRSHSIAHKQKSLEYKLNKILQTSEVAEEIDLKNRMENIAKEAYVEPVAVELTKTEIEPIDDMLDFMQSECVKNNIEFNLQINGNIYKMINNYIESQELEILLADHIKDAIIAINHTDNINRSILVKLGEYDNCYGIHIYDSGVNFLKEILENLGKKPVTSYQDEGGTGMGYMNTFETLRKYEASLIIEEFGMPSKENFTKVVSIKFDKKNEYKIL